MSKYDFQNDLSENTSTGIVLSKIPAHATVLEFGCATGRMTRYMKEILKCKVFIVEYDRDAYEAALQYAEDGVCGDIQSFEWADKFRGMEFDAILFTDVLEHLSMPEVVLERAAALLKDNGAIYISVPNVTHNDVLLKAYRDCVDYTTTGILDDTHIHFWGMENLRKLSGIGGLTLRRIEATYCGMGETEQSVSSETEILLENLLRDRSCGEVYQFVVTLDRQNAGEVETILRKPTIKSHLYFDTGHGFNADQIIMFESVGIGDGRYRLHLEVNELADVKKLRVDPIEYQGGILYGISVRQGEEELPLLFHNGVQLEEGIWFNHGDPAVCVEIKRTDEPVIFDAEIALAGREYISRLEKHYLLLKEGNAAVIRERDSLGTKVLALQKHGAEVERQLSKAGETIERMSREKEELQREIGAYVVLANNKDKYIIALEAQKRELERYLMPLLKAEERLVVRILRGLKRCVKGVIKRVIKRG